MQPGDRFGEYELIELLGSGGQGDVFRVRDRLGLEWALKVSHEFHFDNPQAEDRFHKEARWVSSALRALPRDCGVFVGEHYGIEGARFYAKMRLLRGESLARRLERVGRFNLREALEFGQSVAAAVAVAHTSGALHRDLKPENLFIEESGRVQVLDWGCLQVIEVGRAGATAGAGPMCTPGYAALEQYQAPRVALQPSSDVYSLGIILYEILAGCHPFLAWSRGPIDEASAHPEAPGAGSAAALDVQTHADVQNAWRPVSSAGAPVDDAVKSRTAAESLTTSRATPAGRLGAAAPVADELPRRRWGVAQSCVTMPAAIARRLHHFHQEDILELLRLKRTLRVKSLLGRVIRAEDIPTGLAPLQSSEWPTQPVAELVAVLPGQRLRPKSAIEVPSTRTAPPLQAAAESAADEARQLEPPRASVPDAAALPVVRGRRHRFSTPQVIRLQRSVQPRPISGIPEPLWGLVRRMLEKSPAARPQTMQAVCDELGAILEALEAEDAVRLSSYAAEAQEATYLHLSESLRKVDAADQRHKRRQRVAAFGLFACGGALALAVVFLFRNNAQLTLAAPEGLRASPSETCAVAAVHASVEPFESLAAAYQLLPHPTSVPQPALVAPLAIEAVSAKPAPERPTKPRRRRIPQRIEVPVPAESRPGLLIPIARSVESAPAVRDAARPKVSSARAVTAPARAPVVLETSSPPAAEPVAARSRHTLWVQ